MIRLSALAAALVLMLCCMTVCARAQPESEVDQRLRRLTENLRCLVCQNETLADSNADLAADLRHEIREMMVKGASDEQVIAFLTQRYGDFVLYRPPLKTSTALLWFGPALLLAGAAMVLVVSIRRHNRQALEQQDDSPEWPDNMRKSPTVGDGC